MSNAKGSPSDWPATSSLVGEFHRFIFAREPSRLPSEPGSNETQQPTSRLLQDESDPIQDLNRSEQITVGHETRYQCQKSDSTPITASTTDGNRTTRHKFLHFLCFQSWSPEFGCCLAAMCLLAALCITLRQFDGKPQPKLPSGLTLNTLVAVLSTISRCIIVIPVTQGLLQLKWNWFAAGRRPLRDIYCFDQASRGSWACIELLPKLRGRFIPLGALASTVLIASLATSFITQSTISYSNRMVAKNDTNAVSLSSLEYPMGLDPQERPTLDFAPDGMLRAAQRALFYKIDEKEAWPELQPHCPTANCQWPVFSSLAVCVGMGNVTEHLTQDDYFVTLPRGLGRLSGSLNISSPAYSSNKSLTIDPFPSEPLYRWENPDIVSASVAQVFFIYEVPNVGSTRTPRYEAVELIWHYCVNTYNVSVTGNVAKTELLQSAVKIDKRGEGMNSFTLLEGAGRKSFNVSIGYNAVAVRWRLPNAIVGSWSRMESPQINRVNDFTYQIGANLFSGFMGWSKPQEHPEQILWNNLKSLTGTMAQAMTEFMRTNQINGTITGESLDTEVFITVQWGWLSFLAAQIGLAVLFLVWVAVDTSMLDVPVIKSSNLAELFAFRKLDSEPALLSGSDGTKPMGIGQGVDKQTLGKLVRECDVWHLEIQSE